MTIILCFKKHSEPKVLLQLPARSSCSQMIFKIGVFKNFATFTGKHLCWSLFHKVAGFQACNFTKKSLQHRCFPVNIAKFLRTAFYRMSPVAASVMHNVLFHVTDIILIFKQRRIKSNQAGNYSVQSGKLSNLCFLIGYRILIGQRTFFALGSSLEIPQGHVTICVITMITKN